jgi:hypothetical protein
VNTDDSVGLLREIRDELRLLNQTIAGRRRRRLSEPDRAALVRLLPVVADVVGTRCFSVAELHEHAQTIVTADALRDALASIGSARHVGKLLRRAIDVDIAGVCVRRVGSDNSGATWVLTLTETLETHRAQ